MEFIKKAKRGFTLVELVVVIAVIAILAAVSVGAYFGITDSANKTKLESEARGVFNNIQLIANGNDSNSYMDRNGLHVNSLDAFKIRLNNMSGMTYEVVDTQQTEISQQTIYFITTESDSPSNLASTSTFTVYKRFAYYTPDVGGKCAVYNFISNECNVIDASFTVGQPAEHVHTYESNYTYDNEYHWFASTCGHDEAVIKVEHDFNDEVIESSCTTNGYTRHTCKDCGYYFDDTTVLASHTLVNDEAVPATCTESGKEAGKHCTKCDYKEGGATIPALDHDLGEWIVDSQATCTSDGEHHKECSRCDYEEREIIDKKDHIEDEERQEDYISPTCTEPGSYNMVVRCKDCKEIIRTTPHTIPASHTLVNDAKVEPTCTEPGKEAGQHCTECDYKEGGAAISALGHDYTNSTNGDCNRCEHICNHSAGYTDTVTNPTCTTNGYTRHTCKECGYYFDDSIVLASHTLVDDEAVPATCTESGKEAGKHCTKCDYKEGGATIPALGHDYTYDTNVVKPTCTEQGYTEHFCECGDKHVDSYTDPQHKWNSGQICSVCGVRNSEYIFFSPSSEWKSNSARFEAYFYTSSNEYKWVKLADADGDGLYQGLIPTDKNYSKFTICRLKGSTTTHDWNSDVWNKKEAINTPTNANNIYYIVGWDISFCAEYEANTIYFYSYSNWSNPCLYLWNSSNNTINGSFPGAKMEKTSISKLYKCTLSKEKFNSFSSLIFSNNGSNKTADLSKIAGVQLYAY